ncbi:MAG: 50S ribosomal protein L28 [bacterium]|jgi:large subunit ribosomal protein L28
MGKRCQVTGKAPLTGHHVSHSQRKTKRRFNPNLQSVTLYQDGRKVRLKVSTRFLRSFTNKGVRIPDEVIKKYAK